MLKLSRPFTLADTQALIEELFSDVFEEVYETLGLNNQETQEDLNDSNYIIGTIEIDEKEYKIIHGFPDDSQGAIFFSEDEIYYVGTITGAYINNNYDSDIVNHPLQQWYLEATKNCTDYQNDFWHVKLK